MEFAESILHNAWLKVCFLSRKVKSSAVADDLGMPEILGMNIFLPKIISYRRGLFSSSSLSSDFCGLGGV